MVVAEGESRKQARALVNPVIVDRGGSVTAEEGCLSLPGVFAPVTRSAWVRLEARDADGVLVELTARGLKARVFQHELDHLDGVLFIDHLDPVTRELDLNSDKRTDVSSRSNAMSRTGVACNR
jgi:peptide deformylase